MPGIARVGDTLAAHGPFAPSQMATGSPNVFIQGVPACRVGDVTTVHCAGPVCHIGTGVVGSPKVFINGAPALRIGDTMDCGSVIVGGATKVLSN